MFKLIFCIILFISTNQFARAACLPIGVLGEFETAPGSFQQPFGEDIKRGATAASEWTKAYTKSGCIDLHYLDIKGSIANIDGTIRAAAKTGIHYFIGLGTSDQALAARSALIDTSTILITPTASSTDLLTSPNRIVMLFPTNKDIADATVQWLRKNGKNRIASIYSKNSKYSDNMHAAFKVALTESGGLIHEIEVRSGRIDLSQSLTPLKAFKPDAVFIPQFELDAAKILSQLHQDGITSLVVGTDAWGTYSTVIRKLVNTNKLKAIVPLVYDPRNNSETSKYLRRFYDRNKYKNPTDLAAFSFDSVLMAIQMNKACGETISIENLTGCLKKALPLLSTQGAMKLNAGLSIKRDVQIVESQFGDFNAK